MPDPLRTKRSRFPVLVFAVVIAALVAWAGYAFWWKATPQYSLRQVAYAVETRDLELFRKHVDLDAAVDRFVDDLSGMLTPQMKGSIKTGVERYVETGEIDRRDAKRVDEREPLSERIRRAVRSVSYVRGEGETAFVGLEVDDDRTGETRTLELRMRELPDGYWQVVEISNLREFLGANR